MTDTPIDKLIFALGGDVAALNDAYKQAEEGAKKTGTTIQQNLGKGFQEAAAAATTHSTAIDGALARTSGKTKELAEHIQVSRREMVYFFRELASGDVQRLPATLALFVSHLLEISPAALAAGAAVAAIPIGLIVASAKADEALAKLRTSIILTRNASGISLSQASGLSGQVAASGRLSTMGAERIMGGLIGGGMPAGLLGQATSAAGSYALATGATTDDAKSIMLRMFTDPAKSAEELNSSMHLLTAEQTEQVKNLAASGEEEKAAAIILKEFSARASEAAQAAGFWTKAWNNLGNVIGNIGHSIGVGAAAAGIAPHAATPQEIRDYYQRQDVRMGRNPAQDARIKILQAQIDEENKRAAALGAGATANAAVGRGLELAEKGGAAADARLQSLQNVLNDATRALNQATLANRATADAAKANADKIGGGGHRPALLALPAISAHFSDETIAKLTKEQKAATDVLTAYLKYGQPGQREAREVQYARQLAGTPIERQSAVRQRQEAQEKYYEELQSPETAPYAEANYRMALSKPNLEEANKAQEQQKRITALEDQAKAEIKMTAAYAKGADAVEEAKAEGEVEVEILNRTINAKDRLVAIMDKVRISYEQASQAVRKQNIELGVSLDQAKLEAAAGGNPVAVRAAQSAGELEKQFAPLRAAGGGQLDDAARLEYERARRLRAARDQEEAYKSLNSTQFEAGQRFANVQQFAGAQFAGASDDDLRRLKVYQESLDEVNKELAPSDPLYKTYLQNLVQTNTAMSDLTDSMQKAQEEAKGLADDLTGGLDSILKSGSKDAWKQSGQIGLNMLDTIVKSNILEPMNKWLTSQFSGLIGGPAQLGASTGNPMYVQVVGTGTVPGVFDNSASGGDLAPLGITPENSAFGGGYQTPGLGGTTANGGGVIGPGGVFTPNGISPDNFLSQAANGYGMFGQNGMFGSSGFFSNLMNGGGGPGSASAGILNALGFSADNGLSTAGISSAFADASVATDAASSVGDLSSLASLAALIPLAGGGPMNAGNYYLVGENGPEILGPGVAGVITPNSAPAVQAALGSKLGASNTGGNTTFGDLNFNLPNVTDAQSFIRSKSQLSSAVTRAVGQGRRNN